MSVTAPDKLRDKLKRVEEDLKSARLERAQLAEKREAARDAFADAGGDITDNSPEFKAARDSARALGECEDRISEIQTEQVGLLRAISNGPTFLTASERQRGEAAPWPGAHSADAAARELLADAGLRGDLQQMQSSKMRMGRITLGEVSSREAMVADITGTTAMRKGQFYGIVPQLRRQLRILDVIPTGTMDANTVPYTQESGSFATALEVAEGTAKPEAALTLTDQEATAVTIAHWMKLRKQGLADFPALQTMIGGRLAYGVQQRLEAEVLAGDGTGANMLGILNTTGIGTVAFDSTQPLAELILTGIVNVLLADAEANAIVVHPSDWKRMLVAKSTYQASAGVTGGSGDYIGGGPFQVTPQTLWGVPLIPSKAVTQGTALIGDFTLGAQLFIRQGIVVLVSDSDADDFTTNRVTILGEMRAALAVWRPVCFNKVALA